MIDVSWEDAQVYLRWLSQRAGQAYRLPSEAEWEYAARAGTTAARWWGSEIGRGNANCDGCGSQWDNRQTAPVGSFRPNGFGLYDMLGNAWQWVADCWNDNLNGRPTDERAWLAGSCNLRGLRGGSWNNNPWLVRSGHRDWEYSGYRFNSTGFRVARTLTP